MDKIKQTKKVLTKCWKCKSEIDVIETKGKYERKCCLICGHRYNWVLRPRFRLKIGDMEAHNKFCMCCGKKTLTIWKNLLKQPIVDNKQVWLTHTRYVKSISKNNSFYDKNECNYCEKCGKELNDEFEINSSWESRGEYGSECILTGYKCGECGCEVKF